MDKRWWRFLSIAVLFICGTYSHPAWAGLGGWTKRTPSGGYVNLMAMKPGPDSSHDTLYATNFDGLFRTTDSGRTWVSINGTGSTALPNPYVDYLLLKPGAEGSPDRLYTVVYTDAEEGSTVCNIFKSDDSGNNWVRVNGPGATTLPCEEFDLYALALKPGSSSAGDTLYASMSGGLFKSTNSGGSWTLVSRAAPPMDDLWVKTRNAGATDVLYGITETEILKSIDSGNSWVSISSVETEALPGHWINKLIVQPNPAGTSEILYVIVSGSIYKSTNSGNSWQSLSGVGPTALGPATASSSFAFKPNTSGATDTFYAAGDDGIFKSTNGGSGWGQIWGRGALTLGAHDLFLKPGLSADQDTLYATSPSHGVVVTRDSGNHWEEATLGLTSLSLSDILLKPGIGDTLDTLYTSIGYGVSADTFMSRNAGADWSHMGRIDGSATLFASNLVLKPGIGSASDTLYAMTLVEENPTSTTPSYTAVFSKSIDSGNSWIPVNVGGTNGLPPSSYKLALNPGISGVGDTLYAGVVKSMSTSATVQGVFRSSDSGNNWVQINGTGGAVLPANSSIEALVLKPGATVATDTLYAIASQEVTPRTRPQTYRYSIFKSINSGNTWIQPAGADSASMHPITELVLMSGAGTTPDILFTVTNGSLFKSVDGGVSWRLVELRSPGAPSRISALHHKLGSPGVIDELYAATEQGVLFVSRDLGANWSSMGFYEDHDNGFITSLTTNSYELPDIYLVSEMSSASKGLGVSLIWHYKNRGCGNHVIESDFGETCDDGNIVAGDGCDVECHSTAATGGGAAGISGSGGSDLCPEGETPLGTNPTNPAACLKKTLLPGHTMTTAQYSIQVRNKMDDPFGTFLYEMPTGLRITHVEQIRPTRVPLVNAFPMSIEVPALQILEIIVDTEITSSDCLANNKAALVNYAHISYTTPEVPVFATPEEISHCHEIISGSGGSSGCRSDGDCTAPDVCTTSKCDTTRSECVFSPISGCVVGGGGTGGAVKEEAAGGSGGTPGECATTSDCPTSDECKPFKCDTGTHRCVVVPGPDSCNLGGDAGISGTGGDPKGGEGGSGGGFVPSTDICSELHGIDEGCCREFVATIMTPTSDAERMTALAGVLSRCQVTTPEACSGFAHALTTITGACQSQLNLCCQAVINTGGTLNTSAIQNCQNQSMINSTINCSTVDDHSTYDNHSNHSIHTSGTAGAPVVSVGESVGGDLTAGGSTGGTGGSLVTTSEAGGTGGVAMLTNISAQTATCRATGENAVDVFELNPQTQSLFTLAQNGSCLPVRLTYTPSSAERGNTYRVTYTQRSGPAVLLPSQSSTASATSQILNAPRYLDSRRVEVGTASTSIGVCGPMDHQSSDNQVSFLVQTISDNGSTVSSAECSLNLTAAEASLTAANASGGGESGCGCKQSSLITPPEEMRQNLVNIFLITMASVMGWHLMRRRILRHPKK